MVFHHFHEEEHLLWISVCLTGHLCTMKPFLNGACKPHLGRVSSCRDGACRVGACKPHLGRVSSCRDGACRVGACKPHLGRVSSCRDDL